MNRDRKLTTEEQAAVISSHKQQFPTIAATLSQAKIMWFTDEELTKCRRDDTVFRFFYDVIIVILPGDIIFSCGLFRGNGETTAIGIIAL